MNHKKLAGILEEPAKFIYSSAEQVLEEYCVNYRVLRLHKQVVLKICKFVINIPLVL